MPAKRTSTTSQQPPLKRAKHASADRQPTLAFAARKGSSADAGKANKGKAAVKPDVVELDDDDIDDEDDAALEALAELESGLPKRKSAPAGAGAAGASATAGKDSAELNPKAAKWNKCVCLMATAPCPAWPEVGALRSARAGRVEGRAGAGSEG